MAGPSPCGEPCERCAVTDWHEARRYRRAEEELQARIRQEQEKREAKYAKLRAEMAQAPGLGQQQRLDLKQPCGLVRSSFHLLAPPASPLHLGLDSISDLDLGMQIQLTS